MKLLQQNRLITRLKKCQFFTKQLLYLGHIVTPSGIQPDPQKVEALQKWPKPQNLTELRGFLGLAQYFRKFIYRFAMLAAPLTSLTRKGAFTKGKWTAVEQHAFNTIKQKLTAAPVLAIPDLTGRPNFTLITDASLVGISGILVQHGRPIAF